MAHLVVVSFRLGSTDGVSIEAQKWIGALGGLGHRVTTVAGDGVADVLVEGLGIRSPDILDVRALSQALADADLVVVENMASLPLNAAATEATLDLLDDRPALFRHHDLAWQRPEGVNSPPPRDRPSWRHVTINELSRRQLEERGVSAFTIYNAFDPDPPPGRRELARAALDVASERLVLLPSRAIARKNVSGAIRLAQELDAVLWILGPAEDGYDAELADVLASTRVSLRRGLLRDLDMHDAYAASDLVVVPSTWEGFGNPVLESVMHRRPLAVYPYPVLREIRSFGFDFFDLDDPEGIAVYLEIPDKRLLDANQRLARQHFNLADLPARLAPLLGTWGLK
ncbi:MAG: glycosyltransferase family 4 protein [Acidimicrobiales bacterium]